MIKYIHIIETRGKLLMLSLFLLAYTSCEVLEEDPFIQVSTENFYQNETDALAALTGAYARLKSGNGYYKQTFLYYQNSLYDNKITIRGVC